MCNGKSITMWVDSIFNGTECVNYEAIIKLILKIMNSDRKRIRRLPKKTKKAKKNPTHMEDQKNSELQEETNTPLVKKSMEDQQKKKKSTTDTETKDEKNAETNDQEKNMKIKILATSKPKMSRHYSKTPTYIDAEKGLERHYCG